MDSWGPVVDSPRGRGLRATRKSWRGERRVDERVGERQGILGDVKTRIQTYTFGLRSEMERAKTFVLRSEMERAKTLFVV